MGPRRENGDAPVDALDGLRRLAVHDTVRRWFEGDPEISTIASYTGLQVVSTKPGRAVVVFRAERRFANAAGRLQGGLLTTVADAALGLAFLTTLDDDQSFTTLDLSANFLRPVPDGSLLRFDATVVHRGRTTGLVTCDVTTDSGLLVARCSSTSLVIRPERPRP